MNLWKQKVSTRFGGHGACPRCRLRLRLTGQPPQTPSESLVERIARGADSPSVHWLEEQLCAALYDDELRRGASVVDIGLLGPGLFRSEAGRILGEVRPEFGYFTEGGQ